jgi:hypothetical protein
MQKEWHSATKPLKKKIREHLGVKVFVEIQSRPMLFFGARLLVEEAASRCKIKNFFIMLET